MVVTDLHGDWELYSKYRDYFLNLHLPSILFSHLLHTSLVSYGKSINLEKDVFVNKRLNSKVSEKKGWTGVYTPVHPFFSGVYPTLDHYTIWRKNYGKR